MCDVLSCVHAATFLGCLPNNFLAVNAGSKLGELKSFADLYDYKIVLAGGSPLHGLLTEQVVLCMEAKYTCVDVQTHTLCCKQGQAC